MPDPVDSELIQTYVQQLTERIATHYSKQSRTLFRIRCSITPRLVRVIPKTLHRRCSSDATHPRSGRGCSDGAGPWRH